jgi:hypothetical protein
MPDPAIRDSAGIRIVETPLVDDTDLPRWTIDTVPVRTIGVTAGDPAYEFSRIAGVRRLPNGMLLVLTGGGTFSYEFRFFDSAGKHIVSHGRRGKGPGEYVSVDWFGAVGGDTVMAVDRGNGRVNWLSVSAGHLRSARVDESQFQSVIAEDASGIVSTMVPLGDSVYAVSPVRHLGGPNRPGITGRSFHIADLATGTVHNLVGYDETPLRTVNLSSGPTSFRPLEAGVDVHVVDVRRRRICAAFTTTRAIECVDARGERLSIRWQARNVPYSDEDWARFESGRRKAFANVGERSPRDADLALAAWGRPEHYAPFNALLLDDGGNLWVRESALDTAGKHQSRFRVFDPEGRLLALANAFPVPGSRPERTVSIASGAVLRALENSDGAPVVGIFRIRNRIPSAEDT